MPLIVRKLPSYLLLGITLACNEGPTGLSTGNLTVTVSGLPAGSPADLVITGPDGYNQGTTGTQTLTQLTPGTYTITAYSVMVGSVAYFAMPETQTVTVGGSTATASITYSTAAGNLSVTINGLGTSRDAAVTVTGPLGYTRNIAGSETLAGLTPGSYTISAQNVIAVGGTLHIPSPAHQDVTVPAIGTAAVSVSYAPPSDGPLNLRVAGFYLTQSTQTFDGAVPLVTGRNGYLRVFAVASRTNAAAPVVRVRIYDGANAQVSTLLIPSPASSVPTSVDESALVHSWNTPVSGALIQPGFRIDAEVDPAGEIPESDETDNLLAPATPAVRTVPMLELTFVPIIQRRHAARGAVGDVTDGNEEQFLVPTRKMHPIATYNTTVRAPYTTSTSDTLQADNANHAWGTILAELEAIRAIENPSGYYYGVAKVSYTSGVAGVAYVSSGRSEHSALGWDHLPTGGMVAAHELGHNWGRNHSPCGSPGGVDNGYPQPDGSIGSYGLDVETQTLKPPVLSDIMGYCDPKWIGDYTYKAVMNYLALPLPAAPVITAAAGQAAQPCLLVWGHVRNGELVLEPSFQVHTRPSMPRQSGPYTVEARAQDGSSLFKLSFTPSEVADAPGNQRSFVFAVPISDAAAERLTTLRLSGQGRETLRTTPQVPVPGARLRAEVKPLVLARRVAGGRIDVRWDSRTHPMVMVRDAETGEVLSLARDGSVEVASVKREVDLVLSDGVKSRVRRVPVAP